MVLANNPQLYKHIWPDDENADVEWLTPQSDEEVQDLIAQLENQFASESSLTSDEDASSDLSSGNERL